MAVEDPIVLAIRLETLEQDLLQEAAGDTESREYSIAEHLHHAAETIRELASRRPGDLLTEDGWIKVKQMGTQAVIRWPFREEDETLVRTFIETLPRQEL